VEASNSRIPSLTSGSQLLHGSEEAAPSYAFQGHTSGSSLLPPSSRPQVFPVAPTDYEMTQFNSNLSSVPVEGQFDTSQVAAFEDPPVSSERRAYHDEDTSRVERKRKVWFLISLSLYTHIALQLYSRILVYILNLSGIFFSIMKKQRLQKKLKLTKDELGRSLRNKIFWIERYYWFYIIVDAFPFLFKFVYNVMSVQREEQRHKEMERLERERRKEEERLLRERQREEERFQREQRRENERMEKFLQKQSRRVCFWVPRMLIVNVVQ
jgi:hypothetical protein